MYLLAGHFPLGKIKYMRLSVQYNVEPGQYTMYLCCIHYTWRRLSTVV
jgi:hypothetical protein